jgi:hypothetical protein
MGIMNFLSGGHQDKSINAAKEGVKAFKQLSLPDIKKMELELEELVTQGIIKPEEAKVYLQQKSAASDISTDPMFDQAQMEALDSLADLSEGGLTDMDKAALAKIASEEQVASRGAREAILSNAQARGVAGSGLEMLDQLTNAQDSATRQSARDTDVAGMTQQRALDAIQARGALAGNMSDRDFGRKLNIADRTDAIDRFNTSNRNEIGLVNTGARNQAQYANLEDKRRVADTNVNTRNQQQQYNKSLAQQDYENRLKKASGISGAQSAVSAAHSQAGANNLNLAGTSLEMVTKGGIAASDRNLKKNIDEDFDASNFLNSLTSTKFQYKDPEKFGEGDRVGVMAQDLEKVAPEAVEDTPEGKMVDYNRMGGRILAALTSMNDRVNKLEKK